MARRKKLRLINRTRLHEHEFYIDTARRLTMRSVTVTIFQRTDGLWSNYFGNLESLANYSDSPRRFKTFEDCKEYAMQEARLMEMMMNVPEEGHSKH